MSKHINAEWLLGVAKLSNGVVDIDDIYNAPSIDIIRCGECVYRNNRKKCPIRVFTSDNDFCSYGERSERGQTMKLKYFEATDSNGTDVYLFQLEDNSFISVPKEQLEFKSLSPEELQEMKGADDE